MLMTHVFERYDAIGLAANQIGDPRAVALIACPGTSPFFIINPKIIESGQDMVREPEGCLSIPGHELSVLRYTRIQVQYQDLAGDLFTTEPAGLLARIYQHEIDHLRGRLICDYLNVVEKERFQTELARDRYARQERTRELDPRRSLSARSHPFPPRGKGGS